MNPALQPFIDSLGLEYSATFVPQSQSRNRAEKHRSLNWRVHIGKGVASLQTDYMQGIGHLPESEVVLFKKYGHLQSLARGAYYAQVVETGFTSAVLRKKLPAPALTDVLHSLVLDSDADEYSFEEWCGNLGYDTDSRKAEETYNHCRDIGSKLRRMIGAAALSTLRELFQDY